MKRQLSMLMMLVLPLALCRCGAMVDDRDPLTSETFEKALAILQTQAHSAEPIKRANCMEALQVSADPRAMETIEQGLHDKEWVVRFAAAMAAGERKAADVRPVLNTLVTTDPDMNVRVACVYALRRLGADGNDVPMNDLAAAMEATDPAVRANTAVVLGKLGAESIPLLQRYRNDGDVRVRMAITGALARLGDEAARTVLKSECVNLFAEDQLNAMEACSGLPQDVGADPLLVGLDDAPPKLPPDANPDLVKYLTTCRQLVAARSLAKMRYNNERAAKLAIDHRTDDDPRLRALAALALGEMLRSREAIALDKMLDDPDEDVKRAAAAAVVNIYARAAKGQ